RATLELNIRPSIYKRVHPYVGKITGIEHKDLYTGTKNFPQSFGKICDFLGSAENMFAVWGGSDVKLLFKNILFHGLPVEGIPASFIDVQNLAGRRLGVAGGMAVGLKNAVASFGLEQERQFHNALSDALYTASIFGIVRKHETSLESHVKVVNPHGSPAGFIKRKDRALSYDIVGLYREAEKLFGRKLTTSQKKVVRKIYEMGLGKKF
ncbi:MAG: hypothetical protein FWD98_08340, partial [Defluviitaleaceae bacterium]|nr:hypothetical protein [Defluviitaleaceae bacterium]